jgi:formate dehydrogenase maturation protein FdhE
MAYTINDKRGKEEPKEACRVCGSADAHSKVYNKPTMDCVKYLRAKIQELEKRVPPPYQGFPGDPGPNRGT